MLFPKSQQSTKTVFILVQCRPNTSLLCCTFNNCSLRDRLNLRKKNRSVCDLRLSVHMKSVVEQGFFHEFAFNNKELETFIEF